MRRAPSDARSPRRDTRELTPDSAVCRPKNQTRLARSGAAIVGRTSLEASNSCGALGHAAPPPKPPMVVLTRHVRDLDCTDDVRQYPEAEPECEQDVPMRCRTACSFRRSYSQLHSNFAKSPAHTETSQGRRKAFSTMLDPRRAKPQAHRSAAPGPILSRQCQPLCQRVLNQMVVGPISRTGFFRSVEELLREAFFFVIENEKVFSSPFPRITELVWHAFRFSNETQSALSALSDKNELVKF